jgi:hypothetical protein
MHGRTLMAVRTRRRQWVGLASPISPVSAPSQLRHSGTATGETEKEAAVLEVLEVLDAELGDTLGPEAHDHDGDGVPDHE